MSFPVLEENVTNSYLQDEIPVRDCTLRGRVRQISMLAISHVLLQQGGIKIVSLQSSSLLNLQVIHWEFLS